MKKLFKNAALLTLCAVTFVGCASKVDYTTFKTKAQEALKNTPDYTKANVKGDVTMGSSTTNVNFDATVSGRVISYSKVTDITAQLVVTTLNAMTISTFILTDEGNSNYTYYAGSSFKVEGTETEDNETANVSYEWEGNGLLTSVNAKADSVTFKLTVSYSK